MGFGLGQIGGLGRLGRPKLTRGGKSLASLLFGNGEDGFLFGNFAELDELYTVFSGPPAVAADGDPVGLALDDHTWGALTLAQAAALSPELKGSGVVGKVGTAPDATYDTVTGVVSASRVADGGNQSYMTIGGLTAGAVYLIDATPSPNGFAVRDTATGFVATTFVGGVRQQQIVRVSTTGLFFTNPNNNTTAVFTVHSVKRVPGNHASQSTSANRPLWQANAGKPYLALDGSNDLLQTPFVAGSAVTMAAACRMSTISTMIMGGGNGGANQRCYLGLEGAGKASAGWGALGFAQIIGPTDLRGADVVLLMTADAVSVDVWVNNVLAASVAASGTASGNSSPIAFGGWNNGGTPAGWNNGRCSAALAMNRRVTPAEIARITSDFQRTF